MKIATHYDNLQVARNASPEVIRAAYKSLTQRYHPDRNPNDRACGERVMKMLGIARKQGKALVSAKSQAYAVVDYLVMLDTMPEAEALRAAAAKHNIGERAMRNRIDKHRAKAVELRELDEQFKRFAKMLETRFGSEKET